MNKELIEMLKNMAREESWSKCKNIFKSLYTTLCINNIEYCNDDDNISHNERCELLKSCYFTEFESFTDIDMTFNEFKDFVTKDIDDYFN